MACLVCGKEVPGALCADCEALAEQKKLEAYPFPVFGTQGGGLVREVSQNPFVYGFVEAPEGCPSLQVGDTMPSEWDIAPANQAARDLLYEEQFGVNAN